MAAALIFQYVESAKYSFSLVRVGNAFYFWYFFGYGFPVLILPSFEAAKRMQKQ